MTSEQAHRSIGKVADPNHMGDCEACGEAWPCSEYLRRRLAEVERQRDALLMEAKGPSEAEWEALRARLVEVEQALRPFARYADEMMDGLPDNVAVARIDRAKCDHVEITRADLFAARAVLDKGEPECAAAGCENAPVTQFADGAGRVLWLCEGHGDLLAVGFPLRSVARPVLDCWPVLDKGEPDG